MLAPVKAFFSILIDKRTGVNFVQPFGLTSSTDSNVFLEQSNRALDSCRGPFKNDALCLLWMEQMALQGMESKQGSTGNFLVPR